MDSIYIDGVKILPSEFKGIQSSGYFYANIPVDDGVHNINASKQIGVYIYGYGQANSYGYTGGMGLKVINYDPPRFTSTDSCYKVTGQIITSDSATRWLADVGTVADSTQNTNVIIDDYTNKTQTDFSVELINNRYDGQAVIRAEDNAGKISLKKISIPGLTLSYPGHSPNDTLPVIIVNARPTADFKIPIRNYGKFSKDIVSVNLKSGSDGKIISFPTQVSSMGTDSIRIEYTLDDSNPANDTIYVTTKCGTIAIALLYINSSDCHPTAFEFTEFMDKSLLRFNGKAYITNSKARVSNSDLYQAGTMWYHETVPVLDGFKTDFSFKITNGNDYNCSDGSLPGADGIAFVIQNAGNAALGFPGGGIGYEGIFNSLAIEFDTYANDNQQIENYFDPNGNHVAIQSMGQDRNTSKHTRDAQLAMQETVLPILADGTVYYANITYSLQNRTLLVHLDTVENSEKEVLRLENFSIADYLNLDRGYRAFVGFTAATGCAVEIHDILSWSFCPEYPNPATAIEASDLMDEDNRLIIRPNPFNSKSEISLLVLNDEYVRISVVDILGNEVAMIYNGTLSTGQYNFNWNPTTIERGIYFIRYTNGTEQLIRKVIYSF